MPQKLDRNRDEPRIYINGLRQLARNLSFGCATPSSTS
jgi:hypothetical protein